MRFLANENIPAGLVVGLRERGHDVLWVREFGPGSTDQAVLARAIKDGRMLLTFDKDFGQLAFQSKLPATCGVVLLRLQRRSPAADNVRALEAILSLEDYSGIFAVIEEDRVRIRPL